MGDIADRIRRIAPPPARSRLERHLRRRTQMARAPDWLAAGGGLLLMIVVMGGLVLTAEQVASASAAVTPTVRPWTADDAILVLRSHLADRGAGPNVVNARMGASRYDPALVIAVEQRAREDLIWPDGAWQVGTGLGAWWVWEYGATAPADREALELEQRLTRSRGWE
jgi:hypothetical protein